MAREKSLKLLGNPVLGYAFPLYVSFVAPVLTALLAIWKPNRPWIRIGRWLLLLPLVLSVMLTGARSPAGQLLLVLGTVFVLRRGVFRGGIVMGGAAFGGIMIAAMLTIAREGAMDRLSWASVQEYSTAITGRAFVSPFMVGMWTNLYAHEHGLLGVSNIRPMAILLGEPQVNLPNLVGLAHVPNATTIHADCCFLFDYQASFGLWKGWALAIMLLCTLDFLLRAFRGLRGGILVAMLAAFMVSELALTATAFTVSLVTHGMLSIATLAYLLGRTMYVQLKEREIRRRLFSLKLSRCLLPAAAQAITEDGMRSCASST
jgi:hypothetical protein